MKVRFLTPDHTDVEMDVPQIPGRSDLIELSGRTWIVQKVRWHMDTKQTLDATVVLTGRVMR